MGRACRRIILKPDDLSKADAARLAEKLAAAVERQNQLAQDSPHVLRFLGRVEQDETTFFVEHETATALSSDGLFDPEAPPATEDHLLEVAGALADALRVAHQSAKRRPVVHGGLCPGVLVTDENGFLKVTDFGFAPAICEVLGVVGYLNLAVGPWASTLHAATSGGWQILPAEEYDRDDRLCAFVDPEKYAAEREYGEKMLATFEAGSDIIAAGFILHLLAEHRHPYFYQDPDAHRVVDMSRMMDSWPATSARRKDLQDSENPGIRVWCKVVRQLLARVAGERPTAAEVAQRLEGFVPKIDFEEIRKRQDVAAAESWLAKLDARLEAEDWDAVERALRVRPTLKRWPEHVSTKIGEIEDRLKRRREELRRQEAMEADREAAQQWVSTLTEAVQREQWDDANQLLIDRPELTHWPTELAEEAGGLADQVRGALKKKQDEATAREWATELAEAVQAEAWDRASNLLAARPDVAHWPEEVLAQAREHEAEARQHLEAIELDHQKATRWLDTARTAAAREDYREAMRLLAAPPDDLEHWPEEVRREAATLEEDVRLQLVDDIDAQLETRTLAIRDVARRFVEEVIRAEVDSILDPGAVRVGIDAEEFTSDTQFGEGRARLSVFLSEAEEKAGAATIKTPFEFQLDSDPPRVRDAKGTTRQKLTAQLKRTLLELQKSRLADFARSLRTGLFPDATFTAKLDKLTPRTAVLMALLGKKSTESKIEATARWDAKRLAWQAEKPEDVVARVVEVVTRFAAEALTKSLLAASNALRPYEHMLVVAASPNRLDDPGVMPAELKLKGRVSLRRDAKAPAEPLQTIAFTCSRVGQATLDGDSQQSEDALRARVLTAQQGGFEAIKEDLLSHVAGATGKVKLRTRPKRLREPTDEVVFDIVVKGRQPVSLSATWRPGQFRLELPGDWKKSLQPLIEPIAATDAGKQERAEKRAKPTPAAEPSRSVKPKKAEKAEKPKKPEKPKTSKGKTRGVAIAAVIAIAAGLGGWWIMQRPVEPPRPPPMPVALRIEPIDPVSANESLSVTVTAVDQNDRVAAVPADTTVSLRPHDGGSILGTRDILQGQSEVRIRIGRPVNGMILQASCEDGGDLSPDESEPLVVTPAVRPAKLRLAAVGNHVVEEEFTVLVTAVDDSGDPAQVATDTTVDIHAESDDTRLGAGTIPAGESTVSIKVQIDRPESRVVLLASSSSGDTLASERSEPFDIRAKEEEEATPPAQPPIVQLVKGLPLLKTRDVPPGEAEEVLRLLFPEAARKESLKTVKALMDHESTIKISKHKDVGDSAVSLELAVEWPNIAQAQATLVLRKDDGWKADAGNTALLEELRSELETAYREDALNQIGEAITRIERLSLEGRLAKAYENYRNVEDIHKTLSPEDGDQVPRLANLMNSLPPQWRDIPGFTNGSELDDNLGYPTTLSADGRTLLLVSVAPNDAVWTTIAKEVRTNDPLWKEAEKEPEERAWYVFYIDSRENGQPADTVELAKAGIGQVPAGRRLPTRGEWMLAALKLYDDPDYEDFIGGKWEWCLADDAGQPPWVCGGSSELELFPPSPDITNGSAEARETLWKWLNQPLISQQRQYGEDLVSFRAILPIHPHQE